VGSTSSDSIGDNQNTAIATISKEQRQLLLRVARQQARTFLTGRAAANQSDETAVQRVQGRFGGAFVTLYNQNRLRGCVGSFTPTSDIVTTVKSVTRSSLRDSRFETCPVTADELPQLTIEISLLTDPQPTDHPASLVLGVDGILVRRGNKSGCFLPKVASDRNWSVAEFLSNCCTMKAGLPADAWKQKGAQVYLFRADVFNDRDAPKTQTR